MNSAGKKPRRKLPDPTEEVIGRVERQNFIEQATRFKDVARVPTLFDVIGQDVLLFVFSFLDTEDIVALHFVSKLYHYLSHQDLIWEAILNRNVDPEDSPPDFFQNKKERYVNGWWSTKKCARLITIKDEFLIQKQASNPGWVHCMRNGYRCRATFKITDPGGVDDNSSNNYAFFFGFAKSNCDENETLYNCAGWWLHAYACNVYGGGSDWRIPDKGIPSAEYAKQNIELGDIITVRYDFKLGCSCFILNGRDLGPAHHFKWEDDIYPFVGLYIEGAIVRMLPLS